MWKLAKARAKANGKKGFTLIEMIVVVAIIAILIALLVPSVMKFVKTAQVSADNANAKTIYVATQTFIADKYAAGSTVPDSATSTPYTKASLEPNYALYGLKDYLSSDLTKGNFEITIKGGSVTLVVWKKDGSTESGRYPS